MKKSKEELELILSDKGIKCTAVRLLVLSKFYESPKAYNLNMLNEELEWSDQSTIFRTLKTFLEKGLLHSIDNGSDSKHYALCDSHCSSEVHYDFHPHFKCTKCSSTYCIDSTSIPKIKLPKGYILNSIELNVEGLCPNCS